MLIDWFTVGAQVVNFLILVWLLKRFLYQPVLSAIDAREQHVASVLAEAEKKDTEALAQRTKFELKNEKFDKTQEQMLLKARSVAETEQKSLIKNAKEAADALRKKYQISLAKEADDVKQILRNKTIKEVFAISRHTLQSMASKSLEKQMSEVFVAQIMALNSSAKTELRSALKDATAPSHLTLRSAFDLNNAQCKAIQTAVEHAVGKKIELAYIGSDKGTSELIAGIEITVEGYKLTWSIDHYLCAMERTLDRLLKESSKGLYTNKDIKSVPENGSING